MSGRGVLECLVKDSLEKILKEHKEEMEAWDVEDAVAFLISTYKVILDGDKRHHTRATEDPSYPYEENQKALERAIANLVEATDWLLKKCDEFTKKGHEIKDRDTLKSCRDAFANADKIFESFYVSGEFEEIHKEAVKEHNSGKTEDWP